MAAAVLAHKAHSPDAHPAQETPSPDFASQLRADIVGELQAQHAELQCRLLSQLELQHQHVLAVLAGVGDLAGVQAAGPTAPTPPAPGIEGGTDSWPGDIDTQQELQSWGSQSPNNRVIAAAFAVDNEQRSAVPSRFKQRMMSFISSSSDTKIMKHHHVADEKKPLIRTLIENKLYDFIVMLMVIFYTGFVAWQTQSLAWRSDDFGTMVPDDEPIVVDPYPAELIIDHLFLVVFSCELGLRVAVYRLAFFTGPDWRWNLFDSLAVGTMLLETVLNAFAGAAPGALSQLSMLRILRVVRMLRVVRIMRVMRFFKELRLMLMSMMASCTSLVWALVTLGVVNFLFGVVLTQGVVDFLNENNSWQDDSHSALVGYFGSLDRTMRSLLYAITGGVDWCDMLDPLSPLFPLYSFIFVVYIGFSILAALNIVTSIFIDASINCARDDKHGQIAEQLKNREKYVKELVAVFNEMDMDASGSMTMSELNASLNDPRMRAYLTTMDISIEDTDTILMHFNASCKAEIQVDEFIYACLKLKGDAKAVDISMLQIQMKELQQDVKTIASGIRRLGSGRCSQKKTTLHSPASPRNPFTSESQAEEQPGGAQEAEWVKGQPDEVHPAIQAEVEILGVCPEDQPPPLPETPRGVGRRATKHGHEEGGEDGIYRTSFRQRL